MAVYKDPNTFLLAAVAIASVESVDIQEGGVASSRTADNGAHTHFVRKTPTTFSVTLHDEKEARQLANAAADSVAITFKVNEGDDTDGGTVTLTNAKTGGVQGGYNNDAGTFTVAGVCDSASNPT